MFLHVIFGSKRNEKKIFFFSSSFWPVQDTHTHTHLVYEKEEGENEAWAHSFLLFRWGFVVVEKEHRERERWISRRRLSVCYIEKEEVEKSSRHNRLRVRIVEKKEERKMLAVYKRERETCGIITRFFFLRVPLLCPF